MKKIFAFILFLFFTKSIILSQSPFWTDGTAFTIPARNLELSIFRQTKYGIRNRTELDLHPLAFLTLPHAFVKHQWSDVFFFGQRFRFSSRHGLYFPKPLLYITQRFNNFGLPYSGFENPAMIGLHNEILFSTFLKPPSSCSSGDYLLTFKAGVKYSFGRESAFPVTFMNSVFYRESVVMNPTGVWYVGVDWDSHLNWIINYFADFDFYSVNWLVENFSIESKIGIMGYRSERLSGFAGIKFAYSTMPDKNRILLTPIAGLSYTFKFKRIRKWGNKLFGKELFKYHDTSLDEDIDKYYDELEDKAKKKVKKEKKDK